MSRFGGFRLGRFRLFNQWADRVSPSAASTPVPTSVTDFDYSTAQGIWSLNSTTQFPKKDGLYSFTTATFTPGGQTGRTGPSLSQARSGLSGTGTDGWKNNTELFNTSDGVQLWTVPKTGAYRIEIWGAQGGDGGSRTGGLGARMRGDINLTAGEIIYIVVGQQGDSATYSGGGGGGTFVWRNSLNDYQLSDALIVAGGGSGGNSASTNGVGGTTDALGTYGNVSAGISAASTSWTRWGVGQAGLFEQIATNGRNWASGPGAGFISRPPVADASPPVGSYSNNLNCSGSSLGGNSGKTGTFSSVTLGCNSRTQPAGPWVGGERNDTTTGHGGFGGGGGSARNCGGSGAGGGYSGGNSAGCNGVSGGGGSYNSGSEQSNSSGARSGSGQVTITLL